MKDITKRFRFFNNEILKKAFSDIFFYMPFIGYFMTYILKDIKLLEGEREEFAYVKIHKNKSIYLYINGNIEYLEKVFNGVGMDELYRFLIMHEGLHLMLFHLSNFFLYQKKYDNLLPSMINAVLDEVVNEILLHSNMLNSNDLRQKVITHRSLVELLGEIIEKYKPIMIDKKIEEYEKLLAEYSALNIYANVEDKLEIVNNMFALLPSCEEYVKGMKKIERDKQADDANQYGGNSSNDGNQSDYSTENSNKCECPLDGMFSNKWIESHEKAIEENIIDNDFAKEMNELVKQVTQSIKTRGGRGSIFLRIIEMQNVSSEVAKKLDRHIRRMKVLRGIIARKSLIFSNPFNIPAREMINKRNMDIAYEYAYLTRPYKEEQKGIEINVYIDVSGSIDQYIFNNIISNLLGLSIIYGTKINIYVWSFHPEDPIFITSLDSHDSVDVIKDKIATGDFISAGGTAINPVLEKIEKIGNKNTDILHIIMTDGYVENSDIMYKIAIPKVIKRMIFVIYGTDKNIKDVYPDSKYIDIRREI